MIAAPFLGEFGWEVSLWVPWLRHQMKHHFQGRDITVMCRPGHEHLYEDFVDKAMTFEMGKAPDKVDCQNVWLDGHRLTKKDYLTIAAVALRKRLVPKDTLTPMDLRVHWSGDEPPYLKRSEYVQYGSGEKQDGWVAVHARNSKTNADRNWPEHNWSNLMMELSAQHVIAVGSKEDALHPIGSEDLRGQPLREVCDAISRCQLIVGPSSGPLALAMLCGTAVVWWSPNEKDVHRFRIAWNPFGVEQRRAADYWNPEPIEVEAVCQRFL